MRSYKGLEKHTRPRMVVSAELLLKRMDVLMGACCSTPVVVEVARARERVSYASAQLVPAEGE